MSTTYSLIEFCTSILVVLFMEFGSSTKVSNKPDGSSSLTPQKTKSKVSQGPYIGARQREGKWVAEIRVPKTDKRIWLGSFDTAEVAARAYDFGSYHIYGPNGPCNFPNDRSPEVATQLIGAEKAATILRDIAKYTSVGTHYKVPGTKRPSKRSKTLHLIDEPVVQHRSDHGELAAPKVSPEPVLTSNASEMEPYVPKLDLTSNGFETDPYFPSFAPEEQLLPRVSYPFDEEFIKGSDDWILDFMAETPPKND